MMDSQILHMLNNKERKKEHFCIGFGSKFLTHNFTAVDQTAPSMDQKCQLSIAAVIPEFSYESNNNHVKCFEQAKFFSKIIKMRFTSFSKIS